MHMDWNEVPEGIGGKLDVTTWADLIKEKRAGSTHAVLHLDKDNEALPVYAFWPTKSGSYELIEYSQKVCYSGHAVVTTLTNHLRIL